MLMEIPYLGFLFRCYSRPRQRSEDDGDHENDGAM
jgi:hypothetical protein